MKKETLYYPSKDGKTTIRAIRCLPGKDVKGILQISHGMVEYIDRYEEFASFLCDHGFVVTGNDHLGHGGSVTSETEWGYFAEANAGNILVEDLHTLRTMTQEAYPGVSYFMLGHSMGSFILRRYLTHYSQGLSGALIVGTGRQPEQVLKIGRFLCRFLAKFTSWHHRSKLINSIAFGKNYKKFDGAGDGTSWLSKNAESVAAYKSDPRCSFIFTLNGFDTLFETISYDGKPEHLQGMSKDLPLFFLSGDQDPVGEEGKGVMAVYHMYEDAGCTDITWKLYENDRHEILNELDREQVYQDILDWIRVRQLL